MKRNFFIAFALLFSAIAAVSYKSLQACGGGDWNYEWQAIFTPEVAELDSTLSPLFYETQTQWYTSYSDWNWKEDQAMIEWKEFFKGEISEEAIRFYLFTNDGEKEFATIIKGANSSKSFPDLNWNTPKMKEFKSFLRLALEVDNAADGRYFSWDYSRKKEVYVEEILIQELQLKYKSATNEIMKVKWWFQVVKAMYYSKNKKALIGFLEETKGAVPEGTYYYRALDYLGGVYYSLQNFPMANAMYSKVMAHCAPLRFDAISSYHALNQNDFNFALNLISDPEEKAAMWLLQGYYTDETEAMNAIYALKPNSEMLDLLLTRSMNKMEAALANSNRDNYREYIADVKLSIDKQLVEFVNQVNNEGKTRDKHTWNLAAAYLNALTGENKRAEEELNKVFASGSQIEKDQARTLSIVNEIMRIGFENKDFWTLYDEDASTFESRIYPHLKWRVSQGETQTYDSYSYWDSSSKKTKVRVELVFSWTKRMLGLLYKHDLRSELAQPQESYYQTSNNISSMKEFMLGERNDFDKLLLQIYPIKLEDVELYEGLVLVYAGQLEKAKEHFVNTKLANEELLSDPFVAGVQDCHDCEHDNYRGRKWTRMTTLNRMIQLQQNILRNTDMYYSALALGNAYYNLSYYGNSRVFYQSKLMYSWGNSIDDFHSKFLNSSNRAKDYYRTALLCAQSDEQRAKCEYFIAKCDRNEFYNFGWVNNEIDFLAWDGFKNLKSKYSNTKFYNDVIRECGYFRTYLNKAN
jgi:hypothetical protein